MPMDKRVMVCDYANIMDRDHDAALNRVVAMTIRK